MQHASLKPPGLHVLVGAASLQRSHRRVFSVSVTKVDGRVSQAIPQPKVEECETYLGLVSQHVHREEQMYLGLTCCDCVSERSTGKYNLSAVDNTLIIETLLPDTPHLRSA